MLIESERCKKVTQELYEKFCALPDDTEISYKEFVLANAPSWYIEKALRSQRHFEKTGARY